MPHNGEINQQFGIYKSVCCGAEIVINSGAAFPDCPNHRKLTTIWKQIIEEKAISPAVNKSEPDLVTEAHIENVRLFKLAVGKLNPEPWEQRHLHGVTFARAF
jgi:hypothetical protein